MSAPSRTETLTIAEIGDMFRRYLYRHDRLEPWNRLLPSQQDQWCRDATKEITDLHARRAVAAEMERRRK